MKILFKIIIILSIFFSINSKIFADEIYDKIEMIERYIHTYKKNFKNLSKKYEVYQKDEVVNNLDKINELIKVIDSIKSKNLDYHQREKILNYLTENFKEINENSKEIFKKAKIEYIKKLKDYQKYYSEISMNIYFKLNTNIDKIYNLTLINRKTNLTKKEKALKKSLEKLFQNSIKFRDYSYKDFESKDEIRKEFKKIINETKITISELKKVLKD